MITDEILLASGYKKYKSHYVKEATHFFQKIIKSNDGLYKLYAINIYRWDYLRMNKPHTEYTIEARMYGKSNSFDLNLFWEKEYTVEYIEGFYNNAYNQLGCIPDVHNNH